MCVTVLFSKTFGKLMRVELPSSLCTYYMKNHLHIAIPLNQARMKAVVKDLFRSQRASQIFFWLKGYEKRGRIVIEFCTVLFSAAFGSNRD